MTNKIAAIFRPPALRRGERAQALVLFAAGLAGFLGLVGMSVDVGHILATRTDLQKVADAAALAGAQDLTNAAAATGSAQTYVTYNGGTSTAADVSISQTYTPNDTIEVKASRHVDFTFLRAIGLSGTDVSAKAKVRISSYSGGAGLLPFGFTTSNGSNSDLINNKCFLGFEADGVTPIFQKNVDCTIKYGAGASGHAQGDFGALALDGTGVSSYRDAIKYGSKKAYQVGDKVEPQTGDFGTNTFNALAQRLSQPLPADCPATEQSQVMITNPDGTVSVDPDCWDHPRIGLIPVVDQIDDPSLSTILGFAFVWIEDVKGGAAGKQQLQVQFLSIVSEIPGGYYNGPATSGSWLARLVE